MDDFVNVNQYLKALNYLYGPAMVFAKLSILLLYFQLFHVNRRIKFLINFMIALTVLLHLIGTFVAIGLCPSSDPIQYSECSGRLNPEDIAISSINIFSDFYILAIPMIVISKLQLARNRKFGLIAVFLTGLLACISSILGLVYRIILLNTKDTSWYLSPLLTFTFLELNVGIIVGCLPILPALLRKMSLSSLHSSFLRSVRSKSSKGSGAGLVQAESWGNSYQSSGEARSKQLYSQKLPSTPKVSNVESRDTQMDDMPKPQAFV
ncbi:hypothetical protein MMC17_010086 [Xylographa soralifera]|nr:hypothetical protein [Xylographa soralifera]